MNEIRMLALTGCIGYGYQEASLERGIDRGLDFIASDAGSMDPGPYYLGAGQPFVSADAARRDLDVLLCRAIPAGLPVLIGSAGGGGGKPHLDMMAALVRTIARDRGLRFDMAVIDAEPERDLLLRSFDADRIEPLWPVPPLAREELAGASRVVAMMGAEPLQAALSMGAQVVLAGRCSDSALFSAIPLLRGADPGLAWHLGKTIECAGAIVRPKTGQDCVLGTLKDDCFEVEPADPAKRCTPDSVAAHAMYENPSPYEILEPSGCLDTHQSTYLPLDDRRVRVSGSRFREAPYYTVKLEGVRRAGHRYIVIGGIRDAVLLDRLDAFLDAIAERVGQETASLGIAPDTWTMVFRRFGQDAVLGPIEPMRTPPHEIGLMIDVLGETRDIAAAVCAKARYAAIHTEYEGRLSTAGNLALPFAPSDIDLGEAYDFSVWHRVRLDDPLALFPIAMERLP